MKKEEAIKVIKEAVDSYEKILANRDSWFGEASPDEDAYLPWVEDLEEEVTSGELDNILLSIDQEYEYALEWRANW